MSIDLIQIKAIVESEYQVSDIADKSRERRFCDARKIYSYLASKCTNFSLSRIGKFILRDHSTILYSIKKCEDLMQTNDEFRMRVRGLMFTAANILNIKTSTYKEKVDVFWSNLSNEQQEEIYIRINEMLAYNNGLKKEITYVE